MLPCGAGGGSSSAAGRGRRVSGDPNGQFTPGRGGNPHSFDHYFGTYAGLPEGYGTPAGYTQPNGNGGTVKPYHFTSLSDNGGDPDHS